MEGCSDMPCVVVIVEVFVSLVFCAVFVGVAGGEIETYVFALLTGKEERFRRMWEWI
jgi:hypothetical protein